MTGQRSIRVLLIEDNPGDARLVRELLTEEGDRFEIVLAGSLRDARDQLAAEAFDVVLLDLSLPDSQGFGTISSIRAQVPAMPLIVLTGFDDADFAVAAVEAGAQDFLVKGQFESGTIRRAIRYAIERKRAELDLMRARERLSRAADVNRHRNEEHRRDERNNLAHGTSSNDSTVPAQTRAPRQAREPRLRTKALIGHRAHELHQPLVDEIALLGLELPLHGRESVGERRFVARAERTS